MKKCPKCGKTYDDSWGVCVNCKTPLADYKLTEQEKKDLEIKEHEQLGKELLRKSSLTIWITNSALIFGIIGFPILGLISFYNGKILNGILCILFVYLFPKAVLGSMLYWSKSTLGGILRCNIPSIYFPLFGRTINKYDTLRLTPSNPIFDWILLFVSLFVVGIALGIG